MRYAILMLALALLAGCTYNDINSFEKNPTNQSYLPLKIGNYWNFQSIRQSPDNEIKIHREVVSLVTIDKHEYYLLINSSTNGSNTYQDSSYYRIDRNGFVYVYRKSRPNFESNPFRLNGNDHDTWSYPMEGNDEAQMLLIVEPITVGNINLSPCKSYFYNVVRMADEEYTITLAPGIGFVKEYSNAWGFGQILTSAKINGQVYKF